MSANNKNDKTSSKSISGPKTLCYNQTVGSTDILIIAATTILLLPLPALGTAKAPHFNRKNITDFLDNWENLCANHSINKSI